MYHTFSIMILLRVHIILVHSAIARLGVPSTVADGGARREHDGKDRN